MKVPDCTASLNHAVGSGIVEDGLLRITKSKLGGSVDRESKGELKGFSVGKIGGSADGEIKGEISSRKDKRRHPLPLLRDSQRLQQWEQMQNKKLRPNDRLR